jgi:hypothetical protein
MKVNFHGWVVFSLDHVSAWLSIYFCRPFFGICIRLDRCLEVNQRHVSKIRDFKVEFKNHGFSNVIFTYKSRNFHYREKIT